VRGHVAFPNGSRNYDATRLAVRFWGYDQSMEVPFFIIAAVLGALQPASAEKPEDCLSAFDAHRARICTVGRFTNAAVAAPTTFSPAISNGAQRRVRRVQG
jgi:hypothetical protein